MAEWGDFTYTAVVIEIQTDPLYVSIGIMMLETWANGGWIKEVEDALDG